MIKLDIIAGARPNFMKIAPIIHAIHKHNKEQRDSINFRLIHTGQHYDKRLSQDFFDQLGIPDPDLNLGVGSGSQAEQTGKIMIGYEQALQEDLPDLCIVVGDVTSTMACAISAKKMHVPVAHVEGGIRSGDEQMPEEINRMVTDSISDYFYTTTIEAGKILNKLGHDDSKIIFVGNTMIDTLYANVDRLQKPEVFDSEHLDTEPYLVMTLHRPSNVDEEEILDGILKTIAGNVDGRKIIFPMHPRTQKVFEKFTESYDEFIITGPLPYLEFIYLIKHSSGIITDSGGITEEATVLNIPCLTLRNSTERPETVTQGTNELAGTKLDEISRLLNVLISGNWKQGSIPEKWDGQTAGRIVNHIVSMFG